MREGSHCTEEHKRKISEGRKGKNTGPRSEEVKKKISLATTGVKKTITGPNKSWFVKGHKQNPSEETRKKISKGLKGRKLTPEQIEKIASKNRGRKHSKESIEKRIASFKLTWAKKAKDNHRSSPKYIVWQTGVFNRDGNKCTKCGSEEKLCAHHLISWNEDKEKRFNIDNGTTLCASCHMKIHGFKKGCASFMEGKTHSDETKAKMRKAKIGYVPYNKGKKKIIYSTRSCKICGEEKIIDEFLEDGYWCYDRCKDCRNAENKKEITPV